MLREKDKKKSCTWKLKQAFANFDKYYFSPLFIKDVAKIETRNKEIERDYIKWETQYIPSSRVKEQLKEQDELMEKPSKMDSLKEQAIESKKEEEEPCSINKEEDSD